MRERKAAGRSSRPSTASDTASGRKRGRKRFSLRTKLFFAILGSTLACIVFFAVISNLLVHRQFERTYEGFRVWVESGEVPPPPPPHPGDLSAEKSERLLAINLSYVFTGLLGVVLAFLLSYYLSNRISKPLALLTEATHRVAGGDYGGGVDVKGDKEVEELAEAFKTLSENLARNEALRKKMVTDISHELRSPLAVLRGHLEALEDGVIELDEGVLSVLMENNNLLSRLVEDLRQLALVDAGQIELDLMPVDLEKALRSAVAVFERELAEKEINVEVTIERGLPDALADQGRLSQVLHNLLSNALRYAPRGGRIDIGARADEGEIIIWVADNGPGIEPAELPLVFERFYRTDSSRARDTGGTGLGLSIAKGLVEAQGGRMWAESEPGSGTAMLFTLPIALAEKH
ncbi:MAG: HAMP domain-containing protein [Actinobacteria bacterium]|nr:HAMP domain-containing protein [Actinomycetota bacterium]